VNLERLIELEKKATPGPWEKKWLYGALRHINKNVDWDAFYSGPDEIETPDKDDAEFISEMRNQLPELLSTFTSTQEENKRLRALLKSCRGYLESDYTGPNGEDYTNGLTYAVRTALGVE